MFTRSSIAENVGQLSTVFDEDSDSVFTLNNSSYSSCTLETWCPNTFERPIITYDDILDFPFSATGLDMSSLPSNLSLQEPLVWDTNAALPPDALSYEFDCDLPSLCSSLASGIGEETRATSLAPSERTSSDTESNVWLTDSPQHGSKDVNTPAAVHKCRECEESFSRVHELERHAKDTKHKPFACGECNACFSRQDALTRHREIHDSQKVYPCPKCNKYQGSAAFRRRDHLRQHLWKKHRVHPNTEFPRHCPYECCGCSEQLRHVANFNGFGSRREYSKHMREVHGKETHDCDIEGCHRVRSKGFARISDLQRHRKLIHGRLDSTIKL
jgi:hypothetical protein